MTRPQNGRRIKPSAMSRMEKSIEDNRDKTEWFTYMIFKDGIPFYCEEEQATALAQIERLNRDIGFPRYEVKRVKVSSEL